MRSVKVKNSLYHFYFMLGLIVSLFIVTLCFNLPIHFTGFSQLWQPYPTITGSGSGGEYAVMHLSTTHSQLSSLPAGHSSDIIIPVVEETASDSMQESSQSMISETQAVPILDYAETMPEIQGGLRAYYILIDYPEEAVNQGIEGKLSLTFTVNPNGTVTDIIVSEPLHALLDSAAVQALRRTRFIPGQHLGESARIRMRLPVRFELVNPVDSTLTESLSSEKAS
ncbi:MAG: energy transducer TonB [Bacteroidetes bacterium]|nr:energy transducer TonB [Bacteroidota bacterium]